MHRRYSTLQGVEFQWLTCKRKKALRQITWARFKEIWGNATTTSGALIAV